MVDITILNGVFIDLDIVLPYNHQPTGVLNTAQHLFQQNDQNDDAVLSHTKMDFALNLHHLSHRIHVCYIW